MQKMEGMTAMDFPDGLKLSVVIPVYNVAPYLERCLRSVLKQTFRNQEIILVDDGSTDGSGELADRLAETDARIRVIHQENQGLSGARNSGIRAATGDYLVFLDSDDEWLLDDGIERLMRHAGADIILFKDVHIWKSCREQTADYDVDAIGALPDAQAVFSLLVRTNMFNMSACLLLVRRDFLLGHGLFFPVGYLSEDVQWSLLLWQQVQTVAVQNLDLYGYYHRESSISATTTLQVYDSYDKIFSYWKPLCHDGCTNGESIVAYLADLWVNRGYAWHMLPAGERRQGCLFLKKHRDLLRYAQSRKARRAAALVRLTGVWSTAVLLGWYWKLRTLVTRNVV